MADGLSEWPEHTLCSSEFDNPFDDQDWVVVTSGEPGATYVLETFNLVPSDLSPNANTILRLSDPLTGQIMMNDDRGRGPDGEHDVRGSRITWSPPDDRLFSGTVAITGTVAAPETNYQLRLVREGTVIVPDDQSTWAPSLIKPPIIVRDEGTFALKQWFEWDMEHLDKFKSFQAQFVWEFRRLVSEYLDYWSNDPRSLCRAGDYWTNLPGPNTDFFTEEEDDLGLLCNILRRWSHVGPIVDGKWDEEFQINQLDFSKLEPDQWYYVRVKLARDEEDREKGWFEYKTEAERCRGPLTACDFQNGFGYAYLTDGWSYP